MTKFSVIHVAAIWLMSWVVLSGERQKLSNRVHIVGQRANWYIVAFHIVISRYRTTFTASVQRQAASRPHVRRTVKCAVLSAADVWHVMPQAHTDHRVRSPATASAAAMNRNRDGSAPETSKCNSHRSDAGENGMVSVCFNFFPLYIKSSFTHRATIPPTAPPHTCNLHLAYMAGYMCHICCNVSNICPTYMLTLIQHICRHVCAIYVAHMIHICWHIWNVPI